MIKARLAFTRGILTLGAVLATAGTVLAAGAPIFDKGGDLGMETKPYDKAQNIGTGLGQYSVYGRLNTETPVDIYSFKPTADAEQRITLLTVESKQGKSTATDPVYLVLVDPSNESSPNTQINAPKDVQYFNEPLLFQRYEVVRDQQVKLKKDQTYYLVVFDKDHLVDHYVIRFGGTWNWGIKDVVNHFASWVRIKTDTYSGGTVFHFSSGDLSLLMYLIGLSLMLGVFVLREYLSLTANKVLSAGYLLIKMEPLARILYIISLWFMLLGGYSYFGHYSWIGLSFLILINYLIVAGLFIFSMWRFTPRILELEVNKRQATIPLALRKRLFFNFIFSAIFLATLVLMTAMYLSTY
jgi:hypothetical protein